MNSVIWKLCKGEFMISDDKFICCSDKIINEIMGKLRDKLKDNKEIFLSEDDFKFNFALALAEVGNIDKNSIILEYPIATKELYKNSNYFSEIKKAFGKNKKGENKIEDDKTYIDICFKCNNGDIYFIELKYKTVKIECKRYKEKFNLIDQNAGNIGLYLIYEDVERMENIKKLYSELKPDNKCKTFSITITNDNYYAKEKKDKLSNVYKFDLSKSDTNNGVLSYNNLYAQIENDKKSYFIFKLAEKDFQIIQYDIYQKNNKTQRKNKQLILPENFKETKATFKSFEKCFSFLISLNEPILSVKYFSDDVENFIKRSAPNNCKLEYNNNNNCKRTLYIENKYKICRETFKEIKNNISKVKNGKFECIIIDLNSQL